jgi:hypothetical protein
VGVIRIAGFAGMWPIRDPRALPDNAADYAVNIKAVGGSYITGNFTPAFVYDAVAQGVKSLLRLPSDEAEYNDIRHVGNRWYGTANPVLPAERAPIVKDAYNRIYYWSGSQFVVEGHINPIGLSPYDLDGDTARRVGVPAPASPPTVASITGGSGAMVTRGYLVTFINMWGEESQPSVAGEGTGFVNGAWQITNIPQPPSPETIPELLIDKVRIYRTVVTDVGTVFHKVVDLATGVTSYSDGALDLYVGSQTALESTTWAKPPHPIDGFVTMPNGIFVLWKDRTLYFSENYRPWAYPAEYELVMPHRIVACGVFGNSLVVATRAQPFIISGTKSAAMSMVKIDQHLPCESAASLVGSADGVMYATTHGLVKIGPGGAGYVTMDLVDPDTWQDVFKPQGMVATIHDDKYCAVNPLMDVADGFVFDPVAPSKQGMYYLDFTAPNMSGAVWIGQDQWTGITLIIDNDGRVFEVEPPLGTPDVFVWRSKEFHYPKPVNFKVYQAYFDDEPGTEPLRLKIWVTLRGNAGEVSKQVIYDQQIPASGKEIKLPSGTLGDVWQFEFTGNGTLQSFIISTSVQELRGA